MTDFSTSPDLAGRSFATAVARAMGRHWGWILAEGLLLLVLGALALAIPFIAGVATTLFLGWLLLFSGVVGVVVCFKSRGDPGFWWGVLSAVIAILAGLSLLFLPLIGLFTLTVVLIAYFLADGISTVIYGLQHKSALKTGWGWIVFSGVIDLVLAAVLVMSLPGSILWAVGLLVGVDLVFGGVALVSVALEVRKAAESGAPPAAAAA